MLQRELRKTLRSPLTWAVAALAALLTGHGFVLAIDLFSAGARGVAAGTLLAQQFDPLAGVIRPSLGGAYFAISILGPLVACRSIAIEKERRTWHLLLASGPALPVVASAAAGSVVATLLPIGALLPLWVGWWSCGGHVGLRETGVALTGHLLYAAWVASLCLAGSAWAKGFAQAAVVVLVVIMGSWALDSSSGFAALAWLGQLERLSPSAQLVLFERGAFPVGPALYFGCSTAGFFLAAWAAARLDLRLLQRALLASVAVAAGVGAGTGATQVSRAFDLTEGQRLSLPRAQAEAIAALPGPINVEVELDRDDARRTQLERDFLFKLQLARPDAVVRFPRDSQVAADGQHDDAYGRVRLSVAASTRETFSSSVEELTALLFEAAGAIAPPAIAPEYPGWPLVIEGPRRALLLGLSYLAVPGAFAAIAVGSFRRQRRRT